MDEPYGKEQPSDEREIKPFAQQTVLEQEKEAAQRGAAKETAGLSGPTREMREAHALMERQTFEEVMAYGLDKKWQDVEARIAPQLSRGEEASLIVGAHYVSVVKEDDDRITGTIDGQEPASDEGRTALEQCHAQLLDAVREWERRREAEEREKREREQRREMTVSERCADRSEAPER